MKTVIKYLMFFACLSVFISCSKAPICSYQGETVIEANAGCLVVHNNRLLLVEELDGKLALPGGGKEHGEVAQCTAEREVWEETGIHVNAKELVKKFDNGFHLFACDLMNEENLNGSLRPLRREINNIHWLSDKEFSGQRWRFPEQVYMMQKWLEERTQANKELMQSLNRENRGVGR